MKTTTRIGLLASTLVCALYGAVSAEPLAARSTAMDGSPAGRAASPTVPTPAAHADMVACEAADMAACYALANRYHGGDGVTRDSPYAPTLVLRACEGGYGPACYDLGVRHLLGEYVSHDAAEGLRRVVAACEMEVPVACYFAGRLARDGVGAARALGAARGFLSRACELGYGPACDEAAAELGVVPGGEESALQSDAAPAVAALARSCDHGLRPACAALAEAYELGEGTSADPARASRLRRDACDWGYLPACPGR